MKAMVLEEIGKPLVLREVEKPQPKDDELLIKVLTCGVCRTDLHIVDGDLPEPNLPLILGHQIVGVVEEVGKNVSQHAVGDKVGVPWLGSTCSACSFCTSGKENLCDSAEFTGYMLQGGFAEYVAAKEAFVFSLPTGYSDIELAPLLCAGLIGYRTYRLAGKPKVMGLYGFGSSAHLLLQAANLEGTKSYVFTRPGDTQSQRFAKKLGAVWAGGSDEMPPEKLDAALIFAPVGDLMVEALKVVKKGAMVISAGIHMSDIPRFAYKLLWEERTLTSVANLTREDGYEFFKCVENGQIEVSTTIFSLEEANQALDAIRKGSVDGSCVLTIS